MCPPCFTRTGRVTRRIVYDEKVNSVLHAHGASGRNAELKGLEKSVESRALCAWEEFGIELEDLTSRSAYGRLVGNVGGISRPHVRPKWRNW